MKRFLSTLLVAAMSIFVLAGCSTKFIPEFAPTETTTKIEAVTINDEYSVEIPEYMKKAKNLNDVASLQYQNIFKETYVIVIDENKSEFIKALKDAGVYQDDQSVIDNYANIQMGYFKENITAEGNPKIQKTKTNGLESRMVATTGRTTGIDFDIYYVISYIESDDKLYTAMAWTLADRQAKYEQDLKGILNSFKLANPTSKAIPTEPAETDESSNSATETPETEKQES